MSDSSLTCINSVIAYIEDHLNGNLDLGTVAAAVHYSKYHLHRVFSETVGMTLHDYANRRQLTEAAKLLVFSNKQIIEIASICGYESQQSFTTAFKLLSSSGEIHSAEETISRRIQSPTNPASGLFRYTRMDGSDAAGDRRLSGHGRNGVS